ERAFAPVRDWCAGDAGLDGLRRALARAADGYMSFLAEQRSFVQLVMREELSGGSRMRARTVPSNAMRDAFEMVRRAGRDREVAQKPDRRRVAWHDEGLELVDPTPGRDPHQLVEQK